MFRVALLIIAVTIDGFAAAMTMGSSGIHIPKRSAAVLSLTGTAFLGVSAFFSISICGVFPALALKIISSVLLAALGIADIVKKSLRKNYEQDPDNPSAIFFDETRSDKNHDKIISLREALSLSVVLSADSLATGAASARIMSERLPITLAITLIVGFLLILIGNRLGKRTRFNCNFEKLCGVILILLAIVNLL
ncbi:MAG: manganese efflux pump [Ruminococcus sp.]|jgi:putative sporulation protein YtaF|nr:manganese efflux pump [Ruminococcus sp.]